MRPQLPEWAIDLVMMVALGGIGLWGFDSAFGGHVAMIVGGVGFVVAALWALLAAKWRISVVLTVVGALLIYFMLGTWLVVRETAIGSVIPSLTSLHDLVDGAIRGWSNVLTTPTPIGHTRNLLAVPLISGLVAATFAVSVARRSRRVYSMALFPLVLLLGAGVLIGVGKPTNIAQGALFAVVATTWVAARQQRMRRGENVVRSARSRAVSGAIVLIIAGLLGLAIGGTAAVSGSDHRVVVRDRVEPPLDLRRFPSPLEAFRYYQNDLETTEILNVTGLPSGQRIRLATLDDYDGVVWQVAASTGSASGSEVFRRVGQTIPITSRGTGESVSITIASYEGIWVPTVGATRSISFAGPNAVKLDEDFRYNISTDTGVEPDALRTGDSYELEAVVPDALESAGAIGRSRSIAVPVAVTQWVDRQQLTGPPLDRVTYLADLMHKTGYYSDGRLDRNQEPSLPGHGSQRLASFLATSTEKGKAGTVGNAEQYAATLALAAADQGLASRVVMGFKVAGGSAGASTVTGKDVTAWVEVAGPEGWVVLDPTPDSSRTQIELSQTPVYPPNPLVSEPPPPQVTIPRDDRSSGGDATDCATTGTCRSTAFLPAWVVKVVGIPLAVVLVFAAIAIALIVVKARRRSIRRRSGTPAQRVAAGWMEVCDLATDVGDAVPIRATRREAAVLMPRVGAADLAQRADAAIFGPSTVTDEDANRYWYFVDTTRAGMLDSLGRWERWRVRVNPTSLRINSAVHRITRSRLRKRMAT